MREQDRDARTCSACTRIARARARRQCGNGQYKYVVVIHDILTRWIEFKSLKTADSKSVAKALESLYYSNEKLRIIC